MSITSERQTTRPCPHEATANLLSALEWTVKLLVAGPLLLVALGFFALVAAALGVVFWVLLSTLWEETATLPAAARVLLTPAMVAVAGGFVVLLIEGEATRR